MAAANAIAHRRRAHAEDLARKDARRTNEETARSRVASRGVLWRPSSSHLFAPPALVAKGALRRARTRGVGRLLFYSARH